jgi:glycosyltransferase involved in cell wall biosynthesis
VDALTAAIEPGHRVQTIGFAKAPVAKERRAAVPSLAIAGAQAGGAQAGTGASRLSVEAARLIARMRILLSMHNWLDPNAGAAGAVLQLADAYRARGHQATVLAWDDMPTRFSKRTRQFAWYAWLGARLARDASERRIDVVDCSSADAVLWGAIRSWRAPKSLLVVRTHGLEHIYHEAKARERQLGHEPSTRLNLCHQAIDRAMVSRSLRFADLALFLNPNDRDYAVARLDVSPIRARVVPNGIAGHLLRLPAPESRPGRPARIAFIGGYEARKGARYAAAALGPVLRDHPEVRIFFLGSDCPLERIRSDYPPEVAPQLAAVPRYERSELPRLLSEADVLILPSLAEGWSLALVEGMACGLAPVASAVGGASEVVREGRDGFLVAPRDVEGLRRALERLVSDRRELDRMRQSAHARAQKYSWHRAAALNLRAYEEALDRRAATRLDAEPQLVGSR